MKVHCSTHSICQLSTEHLQLPMLVHTMRCRTAEFSFQEQRAAFLKETKVLTAQAICFFICNVSYFGWIPVVLPRSFLQIPTPGMHVCCTHQSSKCGLDLQWNPFAEAIWNRTRSIMVHPYPSLAPLRQPSPPEIHQRPTAQAHRWARKAAPAASAGRSFH